MAATARLHKHYQEIVKPKLRTELGLKSDMQVPRITKITVNMGVGEAVADKKVMDAATGDLAKITGQKPSVRKSKKSVATFKIRENLASYDEDPGWYQHPKGTVAYETEPPA